MNKHEDHEATCFCCKHCQADYEPDWSEVTPGAGTRIFCRKGKWNTSEWDIEKEGEVGIHKNIMLAQTCPLFEGN